MDGFQTKPQFFKKKKKTNCRRTSQDYKQRTSGDKFNNTGFNFKSKKKEKPEDIITNFMFSSSTKSFGGIDLE